MRHVRVLAAHASAVFRAAGRAIGWGLLALFALVTIGLVLDVVQWSAPDPRFTCHHDHSGAADFSARYVDSCAWQDYSRPHDYPTTVTVTEPDKGEFTATISAEVNPAQDWVTRVREGQAAESPNGFVSAVLGFVTVNSGGFRWSAPTISTGEGDTLILMVTGERDPRGPTIEPGDPLEVSIRTESPGVATVKSAHHAIGGVRGGTVTEASANFATVRLDESLTVFFDLVSSVPQAKRVDSTGSRFTPSLAGILREVGSATGGLLLSAAAWIILLLFVWSTRLRALDTAAAWPRARLVITVGVATALIIQISFALTSLDYLVRDLAQADRRDAWSEAGFQLGEPGIQVAIMSAVIALALALGVRSRLPRLGWRVLLAAIVLAAAGAVFYWYAEQVATWHAQLLMVPIMAVGVALLLCVVLRRLLPDWVPLTTAVVVGVLLATLALVHAGQGWIPSSVRWAGLLVAGAGAMVCLAAMVLYPAGVRARQRLWLGIGAAGAVALAVPYGSDGDSEFGWWYHSNLLWNLVTLFGLVFIVAIVVVLRQAGAKPVVRAAELFAHRRLALPLAVILLLGPYTIVSRHTVFEIVIACALAFVLLPRSVVRPAADALAQTPQERRRAVADALAAGDARRVLPAYHKAWRDDVVGRKAELSDMRQKVGLMEAAARTEFPERDLHVLAFTGMTTDSPWRRALWGAKVGALIGLPWTVLSIAGGLREVTGLYPLLGWLAAIAPAALTWAGVGFFLGFFFPLIRGRNGLQKGLWLAAVIVLIRLAAVLFAADTPDWADQALWAVQVFAFALSLGLVADNTALRRCGFSSRRLVDVHNLGGLALWRWTRHGAHQRPRRRGRRLHGGWRRRRWRGGQHRHHRRIRQHRRHRSGSGRGEPKRRQQCQRRHRRLWSRQRRCLLHARQRRYRHQLRIRNGTLTRSGWGGCVAPTTWFSTERLRSHGHMSIVRLRLVLVGLLVAAMLPPVLSTGATALADTSKPIKFLLSPGVDGHAHRCLQEIIEGSYGMQLCTLPNPTPWQRWSVTRITTNTIKLTSAWGTCLTDLHGTLSPEPCFSPVSRQEWNLKYLADGRTEIRNAASGRCLQYSSFSPSAQVADCLAPVLLNSRWWLWPVSHTSTTFNHWRSGGRCVEILLLGHVVDARCGTASTIAQMFKPAPLSPPNMVVSNGVSRWRPPIYQIESALAGGYCVVGDPVFPPAPGGVFESGECTSLGARKRFMIQTLPGLANFAITGYYSNGHPDLDLPCVTMDSFNGIQRPGFADCVGALPTLNSFPNNQRWQFIGLE